MSSTFLLATAALAAFMYWLWQQTPRVEPTQQAGADVGSVAGAVAGFFSGERVLRPRVPFKPWTFDCPENSEKIGLECMGACFSGMSVVPDDRGMCQKWNAPVTQSVTQTVNNTITSAASQMTGAKLERPSRAPRTPQVLTKIGAVSVSKPTFTGNVRILLAANPILQLTTDQMVEQPGTKVHLWDDTAANASTGQVFNIDACGRVRVLARPDFMWTINTKPEAVGSLVHMWNSTASNASTGQQFTYGTDRKIYLISNPSLALGLSGGIAKGSRLMLTTAANAAECLLADA